MAAGPTAHNSVESTKNFEGLDSNAPILVPADIITLESEDRHLAIIVTEIAYLILSK